MDKLRILLVEDDPSVVKLYQTKFLKEGFDISVATDGPSGVAVANKEIPDVILLDLMLPTMDGFGVLKSLKSDEKTKDIPVVVLTNYGELNNVTESFLEGAAEFLVKVEHTPEEVVETVKEAVVAKKSSLSEAFEETEEKK